MRNFIKRRSAIYALCVFLAIVCIFSLFIPHLHECEGAQCQMCALLSAREMLWIPVLLCTTHLFVQLIFFDQCQRTQRISEPSLVLLKVKLSD